MTDKKLTESNMAQTPSHSTKTETGWRPDLRAPVVIGLIALLGVQLLLALGVSLSESHMTAVTPRTPLADFKPDQVEQVAIAGDKEADSLTLSRTPEGRWVLADLADFPADGAKVDRLLTQLAEIKRPLPIATSEEARKRFKVADSDFERRVVLHGKNGPLATLLFGESGGFRRLFGRPAEDPAVYELPLAISDISNRRDDWLARDQLQIDGTKIAKIGVNDWTLIKDKDGWTLEGRDSAVDQDAASQLAMKAANLAYRGVLGTQEDPAYDQQTPKLVLKVDLDGEKSRTYRISQAKESEDYVLKDADRPYYFKLSKYDLEGLLDLKVDSLLVKPAKPEQTETATKGDEVKQAPEHAATTPSDITPSQPKTKSEQTGEETTTPPVEARPPEVTPTETPAPN
ncbi:DUF4340 domain-containing protein [Thiorhodococcus fuscus]|uniref:DUF4340 domain-containing protein n=1 Tax=Thiorhodococcus fuscus TaxID=527200 RepID=A0ABW4Y5E6_9GAMM